MNNNFIFLDTGTTFRLTVPRSSPVVDHLPARIYTIEVDDSGVFLKTKAMKFITPEKIYGKKTALRVKMFLNEYRSVKTSVSALSVGMKGSGKSLFTEMVSNALLEQGLPVIYIDKKMPAQLIKEVVSGIGDCVVIFEEFGKMYSLISPKDNNGDEKEPSAQSQLINMFSDTSLGHVAFLLTENSDEYISEYLLNRPGRVMFKMEYKNLDQETFDDVFVGYPIIPEIMEYLRKWFRVASRKLPSDESDQMGIDVLLMIRKTAVNKMSLEEYIDEAFLLNIPGQVMEEYFVKNVYSVDGKSLKCAVVGRRGEVVFDITVFDDSIENGSKFIKKSFSIDDMELLFTSEETDHALYSYKDGEYLIVVQCSTKLTSDNFGIQALRKVVGLNKFSNEAENCAKKAAVENFTGKEQPAVEHSDFSVNNVSIPVSFDTHLGHLLSASNEM